VLAIEPRGDHGGDEELGAVAEAEQENRLLVNNPGGNLWRRQRLTCWGQRWPWTGDRGGCACA
jgi:hypothetical protein